MPRPSPVPASLAVELDALLRRIVEAARDDGREEALTRMRGVLAGTAPRRGPGRPRGSGKRRKGAAAKPARTRSGRKRKSPWASLTPVERLVRINAIRKGRGLPPKSEP